MGEVETYDEGVEKDLSRGNLLRQEKRVSPERDFEMEFDKYDRYDKSEKNYLTSKRRDFSSNRFK
jgi:hypothetical protein